MNEEDPLILTLYNIESQVSNGEPGDLIALQDRASVALQVIEALRTRGYQSRPVAVRESLDELNETLKPFSSKTAFVFNLCDGFAGDNMATIQVVRLIEHLGFEHTGSPASVIEVCIDKQHAKECLIAAGIPTPRYQVYTQPGIPFAYNFPAIVKPMYDDASIGITLHSVVKNEQELRAQVAYVTTKYKQPALVEEYINGRELSVSMWGNGIVETLPVAEQDYSHIKNPFQRILTYESKWVPDSYYYKNIPAHCPANLDVKDKRRVTEAARSAFRAIGLQDYGRVDIRYFNGTPYIIDVNEIPDLTPGSGFPNAALVAGYTYADTVKNILELALLRTQWRQPQPVLKSLSPNLQTVQVS